MRNLKAYGCRLWLASLVLPLTLSAQSKVPQHPLDGLTTDEYWTVHDVLQKSGHMTEKTLTSSVLLREPAKDKVLAWKEGDPIPREADVILEDEGKTIEARVDLSGQKLESWNVMPGVQAPIATGEFTALADVIKHDPRVLAALKARGITDLSTVNCGAGPLSFRVFPEQDGQRIGWGECTDSRGVYHSWGRTIEGIHILANVTTKKVLDVVDTGPVPVPTGATSFEEADATPRAGYTPMIVMQPMGPGIQDHQGRGELAELALPFPSRSARGSGREPCPLSGRRPAALHHVRRLALRDVRPLHGSRRGLELASLSRRRRVFAGWPDQAARPRRLSRDGRVLRQLRSIRPRRANSKTAGSMHVRARSPTIPRGATLRTTRSTAAPAGSWCCAPPPSSATTTT